MPDIAFHLNTPDKLLHTCRLLRKAHGQGARLVVYGSAAQVDELDQALWLMDAPGFLPHGRDGDPAHVIQASPIMLTSREPAALAFQAEVLVNLGDEVPPGYERYQRLIEVVTSFEPDVPRARARWKAYKAHGHEPVAHDMGESRRSPR